MNKNLELADGSHVSFKIIFEPDNQIVDYVPNTDKVIPQSIKRWLAEIATKSTQSEFHYVVGVYFSNKNPAKKYLEELFSKTLTMDGFDKKKLDSIIHEFLLQYKDTIISPHYSGYLII